MAQRKLNLWGGALGAKETHELHGDIEANFNDLYGKVDVSLSNYATEVAAAIGGVLPGGMYHTSGALKIRYQQVPVPLTGALALLGATPRVTQQLRRTPTVGAVTLAGVAPSVKQGTVRGPGAGTLALTGYAPEVTVG